MAARYPTILRAGSWSAFLAEDGSLSRVSYAGEEILRGLAVVVRTNTWLTVPGRTKVAVTQESEGFHVLVSATHQAESVDFSWTGEIVATAEGFLSYSFVGQSQGVTSTNRIGLVALHSLNWAGAKCVVTHSDGSQDVTKYPQLVSPHQPMMDIRSLTQSLASFPTTTITFSGDTFEMEDQRNWTDASFKTYSRPLALPFPYDITDGEKVQQAITLTVSSGESAVTARPKEESTESTFVLSLDERSEGFPLPLFGLGTDPTRETPIPARLIDELHPSHIRIDLVAEEGMLRGAKQLGELLGVSIPLELAVHVGPNPEQGIKELDSITLGLPISALLVFDKQSPATTPASITQIRTHAPNLLSSGAPIFVGTDDNFTELNRNRILPRDVGADGVCFSPNPQIHDSREQAILETAEAFSAVISTAREISGGMPIAISPLTFRARRNIHAPGRIIDRLGRDEDSVDPRWGSEFSAVWLLSTIAALVEGGVQRITVSEIIGPRGIVSEQEVVSGERSPVAELWTWLTAPSRSRVTVASSQNRHLVALADKATQNALVANCSDRSQRIEVRSGGSSVTHTIPPRSFSRLEKHG